jgi:hypothetical protein
MRVFLRCRYVYVQAMMLGFPLNTAGDYISSSSSTDIGDQAGFCALPGNRHPLLSASSEPTPPVYAGKHFKGWRNNPVS